MSTFLVGMTKALSKIAKNPKGDFKPDDFIPHRERQIEKLKKIATGLNKVIKKKSDDLELMADVAKIRTKVSELEQRFDVEVRTMRYFRAVKKELVHAPDTMTVEEAQAKAKTKKKVQKFEKKLKREASKYPIAKQLLKNASMAEALYLKAVEVGLTKTALPSISEDEEWSDEEIDQVVEVSYDARNVAFHVLNGTRRKKGAADLPRQD